MQHNKSLSVDGAEVLTSAVVPYMALQKVAHGIVCLSELHQGSNFPDVICVLCCLARLALQPGRKGFF